MRGLLCMSRSQDIGWTQRNTGSQQVVRPKNRKSDASSTISTEKGNQSSEVNRPPARVLPAGGTLTARQPRPHFDSPGDLAGVTLLVPVSATNNKFRCCHRPGKDWDEEKTTHCNHEGEYEEWPLAKVETHRRVRRCKKCFDSQFGDTLTPEGVYGSATTTCPNCNETVSPFQYDPHIEACLIAGDHHKPESA